MTLKNLIIYLSGTIFVWYLLGIHVLANLGYLLGYGLSKWLMLGAVAFGGVICATILYLFRTKMGHIVGAIVPIVLLIITLVYSLNITKQLYDVSFDGQAYQGEAINTLLEGWNPLKTPQSQGQNEYADATNQYVFLDSYPKLAWYHSVIVHDIAGDYKDIKLMNLAIILPALILVYFAFSKFEFFKNGSWNKFAKILLTAMTVLNPIVLVQSTSSSIDGLVYCLLVMLCAELVHIYLEYKKTATDHFALNLHIFGMGSLICVLSNIKTSGLVYSIFFVGALLFYLFLEHGWKIWKLLVSFILAIVLAVCVLGYNPYITNSVHYKNPLYPVFNSKVDYYSINTPINLRDKNNLEVFLYSIFTANDSNDYVNLKLPFTVSGAELNSLNSTQAKKAGFGPLFSGVFVIILALILGIIYNYYSKISNQVHNSSYKNRFSNLSSLSIFIFSWLVILGTLIITKNSSSFRLVPQLWLLLIIPIAYGLHLSSYWLRSIAFFASAIIIINLALIGGIYFSNQTKISSTVATKLHDMQTSGDFYNIYFGYSTGTRQLFRENNIYYQYSKQPNNKCSNTFKDYQFNQDSNVFVCTIAN